jgi:hypothetical protein
MLVQVSYKLTHYQPIRQLQSIIKTSYKQWYLSFLDLHLWKATLHLP